MDRDIVYGLKLRQEAAASGLSIEQYNLGCHYLSGDIVAVDYNKAYNSFHKAASQGFVMAMANLGCMYRDGLGVPQNAEKAEHWLRLAAPYDKNVQSMLDELKAVK